MSVHLEVVGAEIRKAREQRRWTQGELGRRVGVSQGHVSSIERGVTVNMGTAKDLCRVLDLDVEQLFLQGLGVVTAVERAIDNDPELRVEDRSLLRVVYRELRARGPMSSALDTL